MDVVDMLDRRAALFVNLYMQNNGPISRKKRELFSELSDAEVGALERAVGQAIGVSG